MAPNQLRIGNFYFFNGEPVQFTEEHILKILTPSSPLTGKRQSIKPIRLTAVWLLRFGFEMRENGNWVFDDTELMPIGSTHWIDNRYRLLLRHVHELQDFFLVLQKSELKVRRHVDPFSLYDPIGQDVWGRP